MTDRAKNRNDEDAATDAASFLLALAPDATLLETHISRVVLAGARAYKLKKPVKLAYVDFSTYEKRRAAAEAELLLNRRTAPRLYLGLSTLTREADGGLAFDGAGSQVGPVVGSVALSGRVTGWYCTGYGATAADVPWSMPARISPFITDHAFAAADVGLQLERSRIRDGPVDGVRGPA